MNIPDKFPSAVRRYGNHFLDSLLCILNHNFYRNIRKGCYAPQMRQGLDKYSHRNRTVIKHKKVISEYRNPDFQIYGFAISSRGSSAIIRFVHFSYISILPLVTAYHNDHTLFFLSFLICC